MMRWSFSILAVTAACGSPPLRPAQPAPRASAEASPATALGSPPATAEQCTGCQSASWVQREENRAGQENQICFRDTPEPASPCDSLTPGCVIGPRSVGQSECDPRCCSSGASRPAPPAPHPPSDTRWVVTMSGSKCTATEGSSGPREIACPAGIRPTDSFIVVQSRGRDECFRPHVRQDLPRVECIGHAPCGPSSVPPRDVPTACPK